MAASKSFSPGTLLLSLVLVFTFSPKFNDASAVSKSREEQPVPTVSSPYNLQGNLRIVLLFSPRIVADGVFKFMLDHVSLKSLKLLIIHLKCLDIRM